jgi:high-affinity iron transporter
MRAEIPAFANIRSTIRLASRSVASSGGGGNRWIRRTMHADGSRPRLRAISALSIGVLSIGAALALAHSRGVGNGRATASQSSAAGDAQALNATAGDCAAQWSVSTTGATAFAISNSEDIGVRVILQAVGGDQRVAGNVWVPPRATRQLSVVVNPGPYQWSCQFQNGTTARSPVVTASGPAVPIASPLPELSSDDLQNAVRRYRAYVGAQLVLLTTQTDTLQKDVTGGDVLAAQRDWVTAHQTYHRIGAAYGAFGADAEAVDGLADGLPAGTADPAFTGFHKIESLLWSGAPTAAIVPPAHALTTSIAVLRVKLPSFTFDPKDIPLRTHEILEGTARFQFTGSDDYGSGTSLATAQADVDGTRTLVQILSPLLEQRARGLTTRVNTDLDTLQQSITATRSAGRWVAFKALNPAQRQRIDAAAGGALESLSVIPDLLEIRP